MNKIFPQGNVNGSAAPGSKALPGGEAGCSLLCCSRRGACLSAFVLLLLATLAALITLVTFLGLPARMPGAVPQSLPSFLVAHCGNPATWIYSDQRCDGTNNCGDCSDELSPVAECPPCGTGWWRCPSTFFRYCDCIPRSLCRDHVQHCSDWSDEYSCPGP
ncbi:low-density lipoprotein receptor class A domain-containing protein 1 isoform X3 [Dasypus novemcinctus]|uniref:low-density lipoprotein receptor class A domain-containing protein 1 isoform X3 n=1 Tax=Dasypus novemcinctus TaxID=9361 RepID=UPI000328CE18|nr:low-density lipoprotein receptor class A domain-containing protein 1 isoform X3 [Dasypus novemcinctus]